MEDQKDREREGESALPEGAARLFRLLGLHPGVEFSLESAAALAGERTGPVRQQLELLAKAGMITQTAPGRFLLPESFRTAAAEQARRDDSEADQARLRLVSWYLHTADWLGHTLTPYDSYDLKIEVPAGVRPLPFDQPEAALAWWGSERINLVSVVRVAAEAGVHGLAWRLAVTLRSVYAQRGVFADWESTATIAADSAVAEGDLAGQALTTENLAKLYAQTGRLEEARLSHRAALAIFGRLADRFGQARCHNALGLLALRHRQLRQARTHFQDSSAVFAELGMTRWVAVARANTAEALIGLGGHTEAAQTLTKTAEVFAALGDRSSQGNALALLSRAQRAGGDLTAARTSIDAALAIAADARNPMWRGYGLLELGRLQRAAGQHEDALHSFQEAAAINRELGDRSREALALDGAGQTCQDQGHPEEALALHQAAEPAHRESGNHWHQAINLHSTATSLDSLGRSPQARTCWEQALTALNGFDDPLATQLRRQITLTLDRLRGR
ncbi:tetratricopeptide repeat protein [Acrocarpospora catenulata]|uniref:tetratricopeptide repeat protein n=1 Tax=Acrocarpospora catenulata TaxID=2836182 RepID=UPI001BDAF0E3|nr:tetratricopeptide repeat protein [Acrocarpospora catenulata]